MLKVEVASIAKAMYDITGIQKVYFDEVKEGFGHPSLYFSPVEQTVTGDTLTTFAYDNAMFVKIFDKTTKEAMDRAEQITRNISANRNLITRMNEDGTNNGKFRLRDLSYRKIDDGVAQIYVRWRSVYPYNVETSQKAVYIVFNTLIN